MIVLGNETVDNPVIDNSRSKSNKRTTPEVAVVRVICLSLFIVYSTKTVNDYN